MIDLKSAEDLSRMRAACVAAARVLHDLSTLVVPGISTAGLDSAARGLMARHGCESACHGYMVGRLSYPGYVCISLNDEIVHGIGAADRPTNLFGKGGCGLVAKIIHRIDCGAQLVLRREWAEAVGEALHIKGCQPHQEIHQQEAQRKEERRRCCRAG